jgi:hypothetical protein
MADSYLLPMKKKAFFLLPLITLSLFGYSDTDIDGVEDAYDKCPNTPFALLVDSNGCPQESIISLASYDVIVGLNYSGSNYAALEQTDTLNSSIQVDYYYKNFSLTASTSFYRAQSSSYSDSGVDDSFVGINYTHKASSALSFGLGAGIILPTYDAELKNNNADFTTSLSVSYRANDTLFFANYGYTMINDDAIAGVVSYQNTNFLSAGVGFYPNEKLYVSSSYAKSDSIYSGVEDIQTLSFYGYYTLSKEYFTTLTYAYGLSDTASEHYLSLNIGYAF